MSETPLHKLSLDEIRARLGREPSPAEWVAIARAARAERDWIDQEERIAAIIGTPIPGDREMTGEQEK